MRGADPNAERDEVEAATDEQALSASAKSLAGAYASPAGAAGAAGAVGAVGVAGALGAVRALVLRADGSFAAEVETCASSAPKPCATTTRASGTFIAGPKTLTLRAVGAATAAARAIGRYYYAKSAGGGLTLTRSGSTSSLESLTDAGRLARAKPAILDHVEHVLVHTPEWISSFDGRTWADVASRVRADVASFETTDSYEVFVDGEQRIFAGRVNGLHTEATVDALGKVTNLLLEIE